MLMSRDSRVGRVLSAVEMAATTVGNLMFQSGYLAVRPELLLPGYLIGGGATFLAYAHNYVITLH